MKKHLFAVTILLGLLAVSLNACTVTTNQVTATVWGSGTDQITEAAILADEAIAGITTSEMIEVPDTIESGKLIIGSDSAYPPLEFLANVITEQEGEENKATSLVGFEVDLCEAIAKKLGLEPVFLNIGWNEMPSALSEGTVDIISSGVVTGTLSMQQFVSTETYLSANLAICTSGGERISDSAGLVGRLVGVQAGSPAQSAVEAIVGEENTRIYPHALTAFDDLLAGEVDAVVADEIVCRWILANNPDYSSGINVTGVVETGEGYALWCMQEDQELLVALNKALAELRQGPQTAGSDTVTTQDTTTAATTIAGQTSTTVQSTTTTLAALAKSIYQLICEKWGLEGN